MPVRSKKFKNAMLKTQEYFKSTDIDKIKKDLLQQSMKNINEVIQSSKEIIHISTLDAIALKH